MNAFLVRASLVSAIAAASAAAVVACSSSTSPTSNADTDSGPTKDGSGPPGDSGKDDGAPGDSGPATTGACPECADTLCQKQSLSSACSACVSASMKSGGACRTKVLTACAAAPDCKADLDCNANCRAIGDGGVDAGDAGPDNTCYAEATSSSCATCCDTNHKIGSDKLFAAVLLCVCGQ